MSVFSLVKTFVLYPYNVNHHNYNVYVKLNSEYECKTPDASRECLYDDFVQCRWVKNWYKKKNAISRDLGFWTIVFMYRYAARTTVRPEHLVKLMHIVFYVFIHIHIQVNIYCICIYYTADTSIPHSEVENHNRNVLGFRDLMFCDNWANWGRLTFNFINLINNIRYPLFFNMPDSYFTKHYYYCYYFTYEWSKGGEGDEYIYSTFVIAKFFFYDYKNNKLWYCIAKYCTY